MCLCTCFNYTCTSSALSAAASKRNCFLSTLDHVDCGMPGRTSLPHSKVFDVDADPKMIGHQRSSTHGPALSPGWRKFSTSHKISHNIPRRSHSAHPRQGNHTDVRQPQAPSKLSLKKVLKNFPTHPARTGKGVCGNLHSDKLPHDRRKVNVFIERPEKRP